MEVLEDHNALLSNREVLTLLKDGRKKKKQEPRNLATIRYETVRYLEDTPCKLQDDATVKAFLVAVKEKGFRLTKSEKLEIINQRPNNIVELQLVIEESEERFSEEAMNQLLELIVAHVPGAEEAEEDAEAVESGEEQT